MPIMLLELRNVREHVANEMRLFEDSKVTEREKRARLLFLFMKDLMDGINGKCSGWLLVWK